MQIFKSFEKMLEWKFILMPSKLSPSLPFCLKFPIILKETAMATTNSLQSHSLSVSPTPPLPSCETKRRLFSSIDLSHHTGPQSSQ